jgi:glycerophosphoryl diester phosphodiesterase
MPENTIPAMHRGIDIGVTTLEMDVVITKDKQVLVSHEPFFNHEITTAPGNKYLDEKEERKFNIYQMTFAETQQYDVGLKPHPRFPAQQKMKVTKPLLKDLIDSAEVYSKKRSTPVFYNIETKSQPETDNIFHPAPEEFVDLLINVINSEAIMNRVIIQSFDFRTLQLIQRKYPRFKIAALVEEYDKRPFEEQMKRLGFLPAVYSPAYSLITPEVIKECHSRNIKVIPWTVNDKENIRRLKEMGVDGIISDFPNLF